MSIKFFKEIDSNDIVGGKAISLSKMLKNNFNVPNGYVIDGIAFNEFLIKNNIKYEIKDLIDSCNINDNQQIEKISKQIIEIISKFDLSDSLKNQIIENYRKLDSKFVAVRSSASSEDGKNHAWAGQLETFLNVDETTLIDSVKKCWCSIFTPRAIFYRIKNKDMSEISVAVVIQKMIQSEISGIAFSLNPTSNNQNEIVLESVFGLGEAIVSGKVTPDTYIINKNKNEIINKEIKIQKLKLVYDGKINEWLEVEDTKKQKLSNDRILELSEIVKQIENFYGFPVDIEWGIENEEIYILQCRPITTVKENKLKDLFDNINAKGNWKYYVTRNFNWFLENTQIYATSKEAQEELLNFNLATKNYLILNGDEYSFERDFDDFCNTLKEKFENDINFFNKFAQIEFDLVEEIKEYIENIKYKNLSNISFTELYEETEKFNKIYVRSFVPGFTRPEDFLEIAFKEELKNMKLNNNEIEHVFSKVSTCPNYGKLSYSEEPLDLLKIALDMNNGNDIDNLIEEHIEKYAWIKAPVAFEDTCFTKADYVSRLDNLKNENILEKIDNIINTRKQNEIEYDEILKHYKFSEKTLKLAKAIRDFIFLRTYTTEYSDHLFYVGKQTIFKEIEKRINISVDDLIMLGINEILDILKNDGSIKKEYREIIEARRKGFAIVWLDGKVQTLFGTETLELQSEIGKIYKVNQAEENSEDVIYGTVANKGKVKGKARILLNYDDIYKVEKGDIIVATMTTPDYISAMEKAVGFITDEGGITCHAAIISREFDVPCIVGTINGTKKIKDGEIIELDAYNGKIYRIN